MTTNDILIVIALAALATLPAPCWRWWPMPAERPMPAAP